MKPSFFTWLKTSEAIWTIIRLLVGCAVISYAVIANDVKHYPIEAWICAGLAVLFMIKPPYIWLKHKEFGTMVHGNPNAGFFDRDIYAYVRHPWYTGFWFLVLSATFWSLSWVSVALFAYYTVLSSHTAKVEETRLISMYGDVYKQYRKKVPAFFPRQPWKYIKTVFSC